MPTIKFDLSPEIIDKEPQRNARLPRLNLPDQSFLGWFLPEKPDELFMNRIEDDDVTLKAAVTNDAAYIVESHYRGDVNDYTGPRCQYRRYVVDVYLENTAASSGAFKLELCNDFLYYVGHVPIEGIVLSVDAPSRTFEGQYHFEADNFQTDYVAVKWMSETPVDARAGRKKIARIMLYFSRYGLGYPEIAARTSDEVLKADQAFTRADGRPAAISANFYIGVQDEAASSAEDFAACMGNAPQNADPNDDEVISRFALMSDSHVGRRYQWESYDWLYAAFDHIREIHEKTPLDFVLQLGDNIDDGYAASYESDYRDYLNVIKRLMICDSLNPIESRAAGMIPHYEMQGNHDTSMDTRFFRNRMWHTQSPSGEKVYYIAFFTHYGGYPLIPYEIVGNYDAYRSYGRLSDESVAFVEESARQARAEGAAQIVLLCHFGIARELHAPILPETGLGKLAAICKAYNIRLYFSGHEHNPEYSLYKLGSVYDYDAAMTKDRHAIVEIGRHFARITIYNTDDGAVYREDHLTL